MQRARSVHHVAPRCLEPPIPIKHLHPVILPIGHIDPAIRIAMHVMRQIEFSFANAALPPREHVLPIGRILVHLRVAIPVGHIDLALRRQRGMRASAERPPAHERRRLARHPDRHQHLALERAFPHAMRAVIRAENRVIRCHVHAMRAREHPFAPSPQKIAVAVEHDHRVFTTVKYVNIIIPVNAHSAYLVERPPVRKLAPAFLDPIPVLAFPQDDGHVVFSLAATKS
jgi:hypothetical protein